MATNSLQDRENLINLARVTHDQRVLDVAEVLNEENAVLADAPLMQANDITSHISARRTRLPQPVWIKVGNGWSSTTALSQSIREPIGIMKDRAEFDREMMKLAPDKEKYRMQQERPHLEAIAQEFANTFVYGSSVGSPEEFDGLATRYANLSDYGVFDNSAGSGAGNNTTIWLVQWDAAECHLVYPRNHPSAGITQEDMGLQLIAGDNSLNKWAFITEFGFSVGISVTDIRRIKRVCNINTDLTSALTLDADILIQAKNQFKNPRGVVMYCKEDVMNQIDILGKDKMNVTWSTSSIFGEPVRNVLGMPVRRLDAILSTETALT